MCSDYNFWADGWSKFGNAHMVIQALMVLSPPMSIGIFMYFLMRIVFGILGIHRPDRREVVEYRWADEGKLDDKPNAKDWRGKVIPHRRDRD